MILDQFSLNGKVALVSGCNQGIGMGVAIALAEAGAEIIGVSLSLKPEGSEVQREIEARGRKFWGYSCDFSDRDALYAFIKKVKSEHEQVDILFNNAGAILRKPAAEHPDEYWDKIIDINLNAQFIMSREFGRDMLARGWGKIIFTASLLAFQGGINVPGSAASKGGVAQLCKALANEWAGRGVHVNAIAPGYIATANTAALRADPERSRQILERIPAGRWGLPADIAGAAVFLAAPVSDYVNGIVLPVDGAWLAR